MEPIVSIIMPSYNSEDFLEKAIQSVVDQTYTNWELLVIDDGSKDRSLAIAEEFAKKDTRVKMIRNEENLGIAKTRNKGIQLAKGKYIAFLDSDDSWEVQKLAVQVAVMEEKQLDFTCSSYNVVNEAGEFLGKRLFKAGNQTYQDLLKTNTIGCLTVMVKAELLKKYPMPVLKHEDYATWLTILKTGVSVYFIPEVLANYTKRANSTSANKFNTLKWVWTIFYKNQQFAFPKAIIYWLRFVFYTCLKYIKKEA